MCPPTARLQAEKNAYDARLGVKQTIFGVSMETTRALFEAFTDLTGEDPEKLTPEGVAVALRVSTRLT